MAEANANRSDCDRGRCVRVSSTFVGKGTPSHIAFKTAFKDRFDRQWISLYRLLVASERVSLLLWRLVVLTRPSTSRPETISSEE